LAGRAIINYGNLGHDFNGCNIPVFNSRDAIRAISSPSGLRRTLNDYIPNSNNNGPHWHKSNGFGGVGKTFHEQKDLGCSSYSGDTQSHINGIEYRVLTVGDVVVQAARKERIDDSFNFEWTWVGVDGIRSNGIIPHIKSAIENIPDWLYTVFGWDIIVGDRPYVLEINTSPGVNEHTAKRIVKQIERII
jgi:hypothetical protein